MMGRSHALCGLITGVGAAGLLDHAPLPIRLLVIPVTAGSALLPDIDQPSSRVARSLGPLTKLISRAVAATALTVYYATRTELDPPNRASGHRLLTHTVPCCALWGLIVGAAVNAHLVVGVSVLSVLCGLLAQGFKSIGVGFTLTAVAGSWLTLSHYPGWWWVWPAAVTLGSFVHLLGDWVTRSGVPLYWPLERDGRRWETVTAPSTFTTNSAFETEVVTLALMGGMGVTVGFVTGLIPMVWAAWMAHR